MPGGANSAPTRKPPRWPRCASSRAAGPTCSPRSPAILEGASEGELDEPLARQAAGLCRKAGADPEAIPAWMAEGRRRRDAASGRRSRAVSEGRG